MVDPAIQTLRESLRGPADVQLALVFGSRAWGTSTPTFDVDVAVRAPGVDLLDLADDRSRVIGHEVDVAAPENAGLPLLARIVREGVCVYEAGPGVGATWRARGVGDLETDRPWVAAMREARVASRGA